MVVDASVIVAILAREPGHEDLERRLAASDGRFYVSPVVRFEATAALARKKAATRGAPTPPAERLRQAERAVDAFIRDIEAEDVDIGPDVGRLALGAAMTYGKAVGHAAALNLGDCFAYACAKALGVPLLYKGDDFARTDLA